MENSQNQMMKNDLVPFTDAQLLSLVLNTHKLQSTKTQKQLQQQTKIRRLQSQVHAITAIAGAMW